MGNSSSPSISDLLRLQQQIHGAESSAEASYIIVNETRSLAEYEQATLLQGSQERGLSVIRISNLVDVDLTTPFVSWCEKLAQSNLASEQFNQAHIVSATQLSPELRRDWSDLAPPQLLWLPLKAGLQGMQGALILGRNSPWPPDEITLLEHLANSYGHALLSHGSRFQFRFNRALMRPAVGIAIGLLLFSLLLQVRLSVLSPTEVVPRDPLIITAPFDGVVSEVLVQPNQTINPGTPLVQFEDTELKSRYKVAQRALAVAEAEFHQVRQAGFSDPSNKRKLSERQAQVKLKKIELEWAKERFERSHITALQSGIAIVERPQEWRGRPVQIGERIMQIANPEQVELSIQVAVRDAITLEEGSKVRLFLDTDPLNAMPARIVHAAHEPVPGIDNTPSYQVIASLDSDEQLPRIGLRGIAKIYGEEVSLFYYLFRRPITALRQWLGW